MTPEFRTRALAITDLETTGTDPAQHEIVEIGLVLVDQRSLEILDSMEVKVAPVNLTTATSEALAVNGFDKWEWRNALSLEEALAKYADKTQGAIFCSHNVTFDWSFLDAGFKRTGRRHGLDYHRVDLFTAAWMTLRNADLKHFNLNKVAAHLGLGEEPLPHRAITGARLGLEVLRALVRRPTAVQ